MLSSCMRQRRISKKDVEGILEQCNEWPKELGNLEAAQQSQHSPVASETHTDAINSVRGVAARIMLSLKSAALRLQEEAPGDTLDAIVAFGRSLKVWCRMSIELLNYKYNSGSRAPP